MLTPDQWKRIKEIVGTTLEHEPSKRAAFLDDACGQDEELRAEVESLLAAHASAAGLSGNPWAATTIAEPSGEIRTLGPYRLIQILGVGGMGQVWLAEQTEPVRRRVALKLIRAGVYDTALLQRFQLERQSLAIMEHPAIAKVFDTGATPDGQPYFAMEYVDGPPITDYCDRKKLGIRERLKLFMQVCEGVQHAHQKAIIHRDLKPSNILVTEVDGKPQPRIIDFGLAKATVSHTLGETLFTHAGGFVGTPGYMSPEQADPEIHDVDTRTDVYSLGVVLYELLTGYLPFDTTQWKKQRLDEVLRELRETDPPRPSTKVGTNRDTSTARAEARGIQAGQLVSTLRGDLDWITLKALEKERERRYATPTALAGDVARYLENRPVEARPASRSYRLRKYIRRNRVAVVVVSGAAALLVAFAVMQAVELRRITRERDRADRITEFMTNMFKVSDPSEARGNSITAREILDKSAKEIDNGLANDPELKAKMLEVMGSVYEGLGLYAESESLLRQALAIRSRQLGPDHPDTLESEGRLVPVITSQGRYEEGVKLARQVVAEETRVHGPEHRATLLAKSNLAWSLDNAGQIDEAGTLFLQTLDQQRRTLGADHPDTLVSMRRCAVNLFSRGRYAEAEKMDRELLGFQQQKLGPASVPAMLTMSDIGLALVWQRRDAEGEQLLLSVLKKQLEVLGPNHLQTLATKDALATSLQHQGRYAESEELFRECLQVERTHLGPNHPATLIAMGNLASTLAKEGRYSEAEQLQRAVYDSRRSTLGPDHPDTVLALYNIGDLLDNQHRYSEAARFYRQAAEIGSRVNGPAHPETLDAVYNLARVLALSGKSEDAIATLRDGGPALEAKFFHELASDEDFSSIRKDPRFTAIVAEAQQRGPSAAHSN